LAEPNYKEVLDVHNAYNSRRIGSLRPASATYKVPGQPGLHSETLSQKNEERKKRRERGREFRLT
jgi:hypothetical protein